MIKKPEYPLKGMTVLVAEDDYYQAVATQEVCQAAGATVAGPFSNGAAAMRELDRTPFDCAVIDINFGRGPNSNFHAS